ncbi:hypothetical protein ACN27F_00075 [Solwaraspora sp. WMMB335]|uniref:hypothetical protein n=1 Tax=Solwaraspora sp. WMMB335 TaxID=3404118 RepID=UPI003B942C2A
MIAAVTLATVTGGCGVGDPTPQLDPRPRYEQIPEDLCDRLPFEDVLAPFGLILAPAHEPNSDYRAERTYWWNHCAFVALAPNGRLATKLGEFQPSGAVQVRVYHDVAGAVEAYAQNVYNYVDLRKETLPDATAAEISGWWGQTGMSLETVEVLDPDNFTVGDFAASHVDVTHLIRHDNLVLMVYGDAIAPAGSKTEVFALLHDLIDALIDETAVHLGS